MSKKKIFVYGTDIDYATYPDATYLDNIVEETIQSVDFDDYVDVETYEGKFWLTINLEFDDVVTPWGCENILSETKRHKLMTDEEYSALRTALSIFDSITIEFYINTEDGDDEFTLKIVF